MNEGLIGKWSPGIGDPSLAGWLTVVLYAATAWATWRLLREWQEPFSREARREQWFWRILLVTLILLGINKQLDLQSAMTEIGRIMANRQGWYGDRSQVQMAFMAGGAMMGLTLFTATLNVIWGAPVSTFLALLGSTLLMIFIVIRAASFHHVDAMLGHDLSGFRLNWLLEMGALLVIFGSAWRRKGIH